MKIEAVVVCINYADFLRVTLPNNRTLFDRIVVVTDKQDKETPKVCEFHNVMCIQTDEFYDSKDDSKLPNKSRGINVGLKALDLDGWVVQLDADIWLPSLTRQILEISCLDPNCLYGVDRLMCDSYFDWLTFIHTSKPINEGWIYTHLDSFHVGTRVVKYHNLGYMPIGFFQLWNPKATGIFSYPYEISSFDRTDLLFAQQWYRSNRRLIPDFVVIHLASQESSMGQNWYGRKTRPFQPLTIQEKFAWCVYEFILWIKNLFKRKKPDPISTYSNPDPQ